MMNLEKMKQKKRTITKSRVKMCIRDRATSLEIYVTGSLNVFNHQTNVDINNRIVCFDIKELGKDVYKRQGQYTRFGRKIQSIW